MALFDKFFGTSMVVFLAAYLLGRYKQLGPLLSVPPPNPDTELQNLRFTRFKGDVWVTTPLTFAPMRILPVPLTIWAVKDKSGGWVLVDAGIPDFARPGFSAAYVAAVKKLVAAEKGEVKMLLLTHGHIDHVGALDALVAAFPGMSIGMHAGEKPFMVDATASYGKQRSPGLVFPLYAFFLVSDTGIYAPKEKTYFVQGASGDIASLSSEAGKPSWTPTPGTLKFIHTPGHAPGHIVLVHTPTKVLISGDAVGRASPVLGGPAIVNIAPPMFSYNTTMAMESLAGPVLASREWDVCTPAHNSEGPARGLTRAEIEALTASSDDYIWKSEPAAAAA